MNKRQELIDELIKADQDGTYKTYKSTEEIKAMNNDELSRLILNHSEDEVNDMMNEDKNE